MTRLSYLVAFAFTLAGLCLGACQFVTGPASAGEKQEQARSQQAEQATVSGAELFAREWIPNDPRSHGGDGLGPVFNDTSCIACHNQGGPGGGGPASKNVDIASAFPNRTDFLVPQRTPVQNLIRGLFGLDSQSRPIHDRRSRERVRQSLVQEVKRIHPGFVTSKSVVVHLFGTDDNYNAWRTGILGHPQQFAFHQSRSAPMAVSMSEEPIGIDLEATEVVEIEGTEVITVRTEETPNEAADGAEAAVGHAEEHAAEGPADEHHHHEHVHRISNQSHSSLPRMAAAHQQIFQHRSAAGFAGGRQNFHGNFTLSITQRNPTALFGAGLIDSIPDQAIEELAARKFEGFPEITGRVCRLPGDKIGRFGWKSQKASLRDFAMTACAVELGLHVPEHHQSGHPTQPDYRPTGYDMNRDECDALVDYLTALPAPQQIKPQLELQQTYLDEGRQLFAAVGCAHCHTATVAEVDGIYSDLLVHDMGEDLGDTGDYGVFIPDSPGGEADGAVPPLVELDRQRDAHQHEEDAHQHTHDGHPVAVTKTTQPIMGATRVEWRTAPLWGVRDSAPYMHDGRAKTLEQAIAFHGGESTRSARKFFTLNREERNKVLAFLRSLAAPSMVASR